MIYSLIVYSAQSRAAEASVDMVGAGGVRGSLGAVSKGARDSGAPDSGFEELAGAVIVTISFISYLINPQK